MGSAVRYAKPGAKPVNAAVQVWHVVRFEDLSDRHAEGFGDGGEVFAVVDGRDLDGASGEGFAGLDGEGREVGGGGIQSCLGCRR